MIFSNFSRFALSNRLWMICTLLFLGISCYFQPSLLLLNILVAGLLIVAFSLLFNRSLFAIFLTLTLGLLLQVLNNVKKALWFQDLEAVDLYYLLNIGSIKIGPLINIYLGVREFAAIAVFVILLFLLWYHSRPILSIKRLGAFKFLIFRVLNICIALSIFSSSLKVLTNPSHSLTKYITSYYTEVIQKSIPGFYPIFWQNGFSRKFGPFAALVLGMPDSSLNLPGHQGDSALIKSLATKSYQPRPKILPNIVLVLNESIFNPAYLDYPFAQDLKFKFFEKDQYTKFSGLMNVHTFGGNSSISEFEVSTGIKSNYMGNVGRYPFLYLVNLTRESLFTALKSLGYKTIVLYPLSKNFVNADYGYRRLGADEVLDIFDFGLTEQPESGKYIRDSHIFEMINQTLSKNSDKPVFIFAATLSNHGPHAARVADSLGCSKYLDKTVCSKLNDYVQRLEYTDQDLLNLSNKLMQQDKETLLVNFGDHMPSFEGHTKKLKFTSASGMQTLYRTFYNIRANFPIKNIPQYKALDITFLPGLILDIVGHDYHNFYTPNAFLRDICQGELQNCIATHPELLASYKTLELEQLLPEPSINLLQPKMSK